jgi:hypothetical protein
MASFGLHVFMADIKAIVTATGFLALLLALGGMLIFYGFGADAIAKIAQEMGKGDGNAGGFAIFLGIVFCLTAIGLFAAKARRG